MHVVTQFASSLPTIYGLEVLDHIFTLLHFIFSDDAEERAGLRLKLFTCLPDVLCILRKVFLVSSVFLKVKHLKFSFTFYT